MLIPVFVPADWHITTGELLFLVGFIVVDLVMIWWLQRHNP